jgi:hypothetical protein
MANASGGFHLLFQPLGSDSSQLDSPPSKVQPKNRRWSSFVNLLLLYNRLRMRDINEAGEAGGQVAMKKAGKVTLAIVLALSLLFNVYLVTQLQGQIKNIHVENANSRDTFFSIHHVSAAQQISKGKGVKVGIMDHYFAYDQNKNLYAGGADFLNDSQSYNKIDEHGHWMASVLKETAPECDVFALNVMDNSNEDKKVDAMIKAIDWAIQNHLDILTYSGPKISQKNRKRLDNAVNKAVDNNIVTTFINYENENNILPFGMYSVPKGTFSREPDVNIFHYDYNTLIADQYKRYLQLNTQPTSGNDIPYFSLSSTSPITAGFVAILKSINRNLKPNEYKDILIKTSYKYEYKGQAAFENGESPRVVDMMKAATFLKDNNSDHS